MPERAFGLSLSERPAVGLRHTGERRHHDERREHERGTSLDRRHAQRRRARLRNLLFSAMALAVPPQTRHLGIDLAIPQPAVSVTVEGFAAIPARQAYEDI